MNAAEFNIETQKLVNRGLKEGCMAGKMSPAEFIGILEVIKLQAMNAIVQIASAQPKKADEPLIILPPNTRIPGL